MINSRYNHIIKYNSKNYIYNILQSSILEVSDELLNHICCNNLDRINTEQIRILEENGILVNNSEFEINYLKYWHNKIKYDTSQESYLVYPTLNCNLDCPYCFEKVKRETITNENLELLKRFLIKKASNTKLTYFHLRWSGGEPLILWNRIKQITEEVKKTCKKNKIEFSSSLATNGVLITETNAKDISLLMPDVTISVDGPAKIHNKRRFYKSGKGSFNDVMSGINNLSLYQKVILRVNIDKNNYGHFESLLDELENCLLYKKNISIYLKPIVAGQECCPDPTMYNHTEFYHIEKTLLEISEKKGFLVDIHPGDKKFTRCPAYQTGSYMIDPKLNLYKCSNHIGIKSKRVGYINDDNIQIENPDKCFEYINSNPFEKKECLDCKVLPLCNGKCLEEYEKNGSKEDAGCIPEKHTLKDKISDFVTKQHLNNEL